MKKLSHGPSLCKKAVIPYGRIDLLNLWKKYSNLTHTKFTCQQNRKRILQIQRQETKISFFLLFSIILPVKTVKIIEPKTKMNTNKQEYLCCTERGGVTTTKKFLIKGKTLISLTGEIQSSFFIGFSLKWRKTTPPNSKPRNQLRKEQHAIN